MRVWLEAIVAAINSDLDPRATPIYASRAAVVSAASSLPSRLTHIAVREGTALVIRPRAAFADDPLFDTGARWAVAQRHDGAAETTGRINFTRHTGVPALANIDGTANTITGDISLEVPGVTLLTLSTVELTPAASNTGAVTLNVRGGDTWPVQRRDGSPLQARDVRGDRSLLLRRRGNAWRMVNAATARWKRASCCHSRPPARPQRPRMLWLERLPRCARTSTARLTAARCFTAMMPS